jgi:hypothetical protein
MPEKAKPAIKAAQQHFPMIALSDITARYKREAAVPAAFLGTDAVGISYHSSE